MDESVQSEARFDVSASFGRFENDALPWEKWSSFSPNKYLEDVGSLSTSGSVAQKKAFFEAHYKKIGAKKTEVLEQEKLNIPDFLSSDGNDSYETYTESPNGANLVEENPDESCFGVLPCEDDNEAISFEVIVPEACKIDLVSSIASAIERVESATDVNDRRSLTQETEDELNGHVDHPESNLTRNGEAEMGVTCRKNSQVGVDKFLSKPSAVRRKPYCKLNNTAVTRAQKVTPTTREGTEKKLQPSNSEKSKPVSQSTPTSVSQSLKKKVSNGPPQPISKKITPIPLHISLDSGPANSLAAHSMMRQSLVFEKMGDKGVLKRTFNSFQKKPSTTNHLESRQGASISAMPKVPFSQTPLKSNESDKNSKHWGEKGCHEKDHSQKFIRNKIESSAFRIA